MPAYRVTQRVYGYRRYLVQARSWQAAKRLVEEACPQDMALAGAELPAGIELDQSSLDDPDGCFLDEVVFVDSGDGAQTFYEV